MLDALPAQVMPDQGITRAASCKRASPFLGEPVVGEESCLGQAIERGRALVRRDTGSVQSLL
jgi:hypothetical protein